MKFSHSIQLNAAPEWKDNYLAYSQLKKIIYAIEKAMLGVSRLPSSPHDIEEGESSPLIEEAAQPLLAQVSPEDANAFFIRALDEQLEKISNFYTRKEREILAEVDSLIGDVMNVEEHEAERRNLDLGTAGPSSLRIVVEEPAGFAPGSSVPSPRHSTWPRRPGSTPTSEVEDSSRLVGEYIPSLIWSSRSLKQQRHKFTKRATEIFILTCELKDYVELNYTGFSKILKKYDKVTGNKLRGQYMATKVDLAYPFRPQTRENLNHTIDKIVSVYARIDTDGKFSLALAELKGHLREHIIWERNTIWKDMIEQERRRETIGLRPKAVAKEVAHVKREIKFFGRKYEIPSIPLGTLKLLICLSVFLFLLAYPTFEKPEQRNCLAILVFVSMLWAMEVFPLFITAIIVPCLVVLLRVLRVPEYTPEGGTQYHRMPAKDAAKKIFSDMFGPVIMLLLGGFSLAAALSKHHIAKGMASFVLGKAGSKPQSVLLANMFVSTFASMWISNVAAPVLCFSLVTPILRNLPSRSAYARSLIMGIALAANVGGMASPIASPQNIIAVATMNPPPSWLEWFAVSIPVAITIDLIIWAVLLFIYRPSPAEAAAPPELFSHSFFAEHSLDKKQWYIIIVSILTIVLWCAESAMEGVVGDMGVIAIFPIVAFYGAGLLTKDDWNSMLWSVVMLAMGGIALGKAVDSSGLLAEITHTLIPYLEDLSPFMCLALFSGLVLVVTTFISHTVGALIILPIILKVGSSLPDPRPNTLVMAAALMCSGAMGLPVSSFPNMNAVSLEDPKGMPWVDVGDFLKVGIPSSFVAWVVVLCIGYPIMSVLGLQ